MNTLDYNTPNYIGKIDCGKFEELSSDSDLWKPKHELNVNEFQLFVEHQEQDFIHSNEDQIGGYVKDYYGKSFFEGHINKTTNKIIFAIRYNTESIERGAYKGALYYEGLIKKISKNPCFGEYCGEYIFGLITGEYNNIIKPFIMKKKR